MITWYTKDTIQGKCPGFATLLLILEVFWSDRCSELSPHEVTLERFGFDCLDRFCLPNFVLSLDRLSQQTLWNPHDLENEKLFSLQLWMVEHSPKYPPDPTQNVASRFPFLAFPRRISNFITASFMIWGTVSDCCSNLIVVQEFLTGISKIVTNSTWLGLGPQLL